MVEVSDNNHKKSLDNIVCSPAMRAYFNSLEQGAQNCYDIATRARAKGFDPELNSEIIETEDLAARVEGLVGPESIAARILTTVKHYHLQLPRKLLRVKNLVTARNGSTRRSGQAWQY